MQINDISILLHPALIAAAFKKNEIDLYILWCVLKGIDHNHEKHNRSGLVNIDMILRIGIPLFDIQQGQMYKKIRDGIGTYWSKPHGKKGNMQCILYSRKRIVMHLQPIKMHTFSFVIPFDDLVPDIDKNNSKHIKSYLMCLFASRMGLLHPNSHASIADNTGVSISTVKRLLDYNDDIKKRSNIHIIYETFSLSDALQKRKEQNEAFRYRVLFIDKRWCVCQGLPNSYEMPVKLSKNKIPSSQCQPHVDSDQRYFNKEDKTIQGTFILDEKILKDDKILNIWRQNSSIDKNKPSEEL